MTAMTVRLEPRPEDRAWAMQVVGEYLQTQKAVQALLDDSLSRINARQREATSAAVNLLGMCTWRFAEWQIDAARRFGGDYVLACLEAFMDDEQMVSRENAEEKVQEWSEVINAYGEGLRKDE